MKNHLPLNVSFTAFKTQEFESSLKGKTIYFTPPRWRKSAVFFAATSGLKFKKA
jgi:hypothetical protein